MSRKGKKKNGVSSIIPLPLPNDVWTGADGKEWRDLCVDSRSDTGLFWVRERMHDNSYHLVVAVVGMHHMSKEISRVDAKALFDVMPNKIEYAAAFPKHVKIFSKKESKEKESDTDESG